MEHVHGYAVWIWTCSKYRDIDMHVDIDIDLNIDMDININIDIEIDMYIDMDIVVHIDMIIDTTNSYFLKINKLRA
jgi:hypothetical protein